MNQETTAKIPAVSAGEDNTTQGPAQFWVVGIIDSAYLTKGKYPTFTVKLTLDNADVVLQRELRRHGIPGLESYIVKTLLSVTTSVDHVKDQIVAREPGLEDDEDDEQAKMFASFSRVKR